MSFEHNETMILLTDLKHMGFSEKLIDELLPAPELKVNPRRPGGPRMRLWHEDDVREAMKTDAYQSRLPVWLKRHNAGKKAAAARRRAVEAREDEERAATRELLDRLVKEITPPKILKRGELRRRALESRHAWAAYRGTLYDGDPLDCDDEETIERWMVNYVRHEMMDYDAALEKLHGEGSFDAAREYREAVLRAIAKAYPYLAEACLSAELRRWDMDARIDYFMKHFRDDNEYDPESTLVREFLYYLETDALDQLFPEAFGEARPKE